MQIPKLHFNFIIKLSGQVIVMQMNLRSHHEILYLRGFTNSCSMNGAEEWAAPYSYCVQVFM